MCYYQYLQVITVLYNDVPSCTSEFQKVDVQICVFDKYIYWIERKNKIRGPYTRTIYYYIIYYIIHILCYTRLYVNITSLYIHAHTIHIKTETSYKIYELYYILIFYRKRIRSLLSFLLKYISIYLMLIIVSLILLILLKYDVVSLSSQAPRIFV